MEQMELDLFEDVDYIMSSAIWTNTAQGISVGNWSNGFSSGPTDIEKQILSRLESIEKRLYIVDCSNLTDEQREDLSTAYGEYKMIEKMILGDCNESNK